MELKEIQISLYVAGRGHAFLLSPAGILKAFLQKCIALVIWEYNNPDIVL